jgi:hypothetical protein
MKAKLFSLGVLIALGAFVASLVPIKASAQDMGEDDNTSDYSTSDNTSSYGQQDYGQQMNYGGPSYDYSMGMRGYGGYGGYGYYSQYRRFITYPRTVYLVDASNSANQINIINATRGGSTVAAYIVVRPEVYNRVVDDYSELGLVSVRVNRATGLVTFMTINGTYSTYPISISRGY